MSAAAATPIPSRSAEALEVYFHKMPKRCLHQEFAVLGILLHEAISRGREPVVVDVNRLADWANETHAGSAVDVMRRLEGKGLIKMSIREGLRLVHVIDPMLEAAAK